MKSVTWSLACASHQVALAIDRIPRLFAMGARLTEFSCGAWSKSILAATEPGEAFGGAEHLRGTVPMILTGWVGTWMQDLVWMYK